MQTYIALTLCHFYKKSLKVYNILNIAPNDAKLVDILDKLIAKTESILNTHRIYAINILLNHVFLRKKADLNFSSSEKLPKRTYDKC